MSDSTIKSIFDHLRNMFIGATTLAFAVLLTVLGSLSIVGAFGLLAYNSLHGMKKLQDSLSKPKAIIISIIYYPIILEIIRVDWMSRIDF